MPRAYTIATAALALGVTPKWLDNTLSHHEVPGVDQARQGVQRRLSVEALLQLRLTLDLLEEIGMPLRKAIATASSIIEMNGEIITGSGLSIHASLSELRSQVEAAIGAAVEVAPTPARGRPPKNKTGRLS